MDKINIVELKRTMEDSYIDYAMSVIAQRALPDVRDGLKPVQRRILYSMLELNLYPEKPYRKCARIVGDTMGKYHPHGDTSIYDALVKLAQDFSIRYPLVDGHGNYGSIDGDGAAAMRYTEAKLSKISMELLSEINKDTVNLIPNFDETEKEPEVLPAKFPNLLVNGTTGIAVGMATNIPPHNLGEVVDGVIKIIDNKVVENRDTNDEEVISIIKGPDFPTGALAVGYEGIKEAYLTGRGKITVKSVCDIETASNGKSKIVVTEIPYMVNKSRLIEKIADLVRDKKIDGISDIRDESNRNGIRVIIDIKRDANANIVLNQLYKHTQLRDTFSVNMLALVNNQPKILSLLQILKLYLDHQVEVITRRTKFELEKAKSREHILQGLKIALDNIDEVINIIRSSQTVLEAKDRLQERFNLTQIQASSIVEMRIKTLTGLEKTKILNELEEILKTISRLEEILSSENKVLSIIKEELLEIKNKFSDKRRTKIVPDEDEISMEDLINNDVMVLTRSKLGYVKRMDTENFKNQSRGGRGIKGTTNIEDDFTEDIMTLNNHDKLLIFTNKGNVFLKKAYEIPKASRTARGTAIINLIEIDKDETIKFMKPVKNEVDEDSYLITITKFGIFRKTPLCEFMNINRKGKKGISLFNGDEVVDIKIIENDQPIYIVTKNGKLISFNTSIIRPLSRIAKGVRGIKLYDNDEVVSLQCKNDGDKLLFITEKGFGKSTSIDEFNEQKRGGYGNICYKPNESTGKLVNTLSVFGSEEVMLITDNGIVIRMDVSSINQYGRQAKGVKVMKLDSDDKIVSISKAIIEEKDDYEEL